MAELKFKTGDKAKIIDNTCGHLFNIGTIVRLEVCDTAYKAYNEDEYWWVNDDDLTPIDAIIEEQPRMHTWIDGQCSKCGEYLSNITNDYISSFVLSQIAFCPFCGNKRERDKNE